MIIIPNHISRPAQYTGIEPNRIVKDLKDVSVRFALCFPDVYEVGMSYYGYFLLYELANTVEGVWCERCFAPWHDMDLYLRQSNIPLRTLESRTPLSNLDLVGFSLSYELNVTNVLNMLKLGGIPSKAEDRQEGPIVIGGGPLMLNPKPFERFFDLIVVGEAEEVLVEILKTFKGMKGRPRADIMSELAKLEGVYSPLFPKESVKRQYIRDLDTSYHALKPPIPVLGSIHNRLNVEISRGCGSGCRFCLAGFGYRPYRERSLGKVKEIIDRSLEHTGYEEISLLSLSSGDYSGLLKTISYIKEHHKGISVSLPSLKIGSLGEDEIGAIGGIARTGFTFALESASAGIRCMLNKNIDVDMLLGQLPLLRKFGWRRLKMYFIVGFPGEKEEDLAIIKELVRPFEKAGIEINLSVAPFTPKPHTPFQWLPMEDEDVLKEKMSMIKMFLKKKGVRLKYRDIGTSMIEGIISRGDNALAPLFQYLAEEGVKLEAWREFFRPELYLEWFNKKGVEVQSYLGSRALNDPLPWDFIDTGIDRSFLRDEMRRAELREMTTDCYTGCAACGIGCNKARDALRVTRDESNTSSSELRVASCELNPMDSKQPETRNGKPETVTPKQPAISAIQPRGTLDNLQPATSSRFTLRYGKYGEARYIGHIDTMNILLRVLRTSGVPIKMHGKYHPMPNIALSDALPVGIESVCELMEVQTDDGVVLDRVVLEIMNRMLPTGMKIYEIIEGRLQSVVKEYVYILIAGEEVEMEGLKRWKKTGKNHYYLWQGKGIKSFWQQGVFKRILKARCRETYGL